MYREITSDIQIDVEPAFLPENSNPGAGYFFFAYRIRIKNLGSGRAQLMSRHWMITDGNGRTEHVRGAGVVGEQPKLDEGEEFEYTSFCPLPTPTGNMRGTYRMALSREGRVDLVDVRIPLFFLRAESVMH